MLKRIVLATVIGLGMITGAAVAAAQPPEEEPVEQPRPLIAAAAACQDGSADVQVFLYEDRDQPFTVLLVNLAGSATRTQTTSLDEDKLAHVTTFAGVATGEYLVAVEGEDDPEDSVRVTVKDCADLDPADGPLKIDVECRAGWGIVTFQVANPNGEVVSYTLRVGAIDEFEGELGPGMFVQISQNGYEEGTYTARLRGDGLDVTQRFSVTCASGNPPVLDVTVTCAGSTGRVSVEVSNRNRERVGYTVRLGQLTETVSVAAGERGSVTFSGVANGTHPVVVTGGDTEATGVADVECGSTTTTTTTTSTTTTTTAVTGTTTSATGTTSTTPAPQGRQVGRGLASTGAAVVGLAGLGVVGLALGATLVVLGRRRRVRQR